jgi:hypothetical protein
MSRFLLRRGNDVVCLVVLATMAVCLSGMQLKAQPAAQSSNPPITGELTVSRNPHYFQDAKGAPLILNGSQSWNTLQDYGTDGSVQPLDFDAFRQISHRPWTQLYSAVDLGDAEVLQSAHHLEFSTGFHGQSGSF